MKQKQHFLVIDQNAVTTSWNGSPLTLNPNDNVSMPQTTNGSMVFAYQNTSPSNNQGTLSLTSGGAAPQFLNAPALVNQPSILVKNWEGNNLSVTNVSQPGSNTPIWIEAFGPGLPGQTVVALPTDGTSIPLNPTTPGGAIQVAQGTAAPQWMQLLMQANNPSLTIFALIGGPVDQAGNNAYVIALNSSQNSGPGTGVAPPAGYYATTTSNLYTFQFNWGSSSLFVTNMSPSTASGAKLSLRKL